MRHFQAQPDQCSKRVQRPRFGFNIQNYLFNFLKPRISAVFLTAIFVLLTLISSIGFSGLGSDKARSKVDAAPNTNIGFQARLYNADGSVVPDGYYNVEFKLYDAATSSGSSQGSCTGDSNCLWTETYYDSNGVAPGNDNRVRVVNGYLSVPLGSLTAFPSSINWDQELWVSLNIGGYAQTATPTYDGVMTPRLKLTAVPFALRAGQLADVNGSNTSILDFIAPTANRTQYLPDASGTVLLDSTGFANNGNSFGGLATLGTNDSNDLVFETNGTEKVRIESGGDVGIGVTNPVEKLDVNGAVRIGNTTNSNAGTMRWTGTDFEGYNGTEWKSLTSTGGLVVNPTANKIKSADETQNSTVNPTATLQDDDELFFNIGANESWTFRIVIQSTSGTVPDYKFSVTAPSGATCKFGVQDAEGAVSNANLGCGVSSGAIAGNGATHDVYEILGSVVNGSTAGPVTLQWAQNTANAGNTIVRAGSTLNAVRVSGSGQTAEAFIQDGNSFSADAVIGTNDNYGLKIETNGVERANFSATGLLTLLQGASVANGLNLTSGNYQFNGTDIITSGGVLQNVTANTSMLTSGTLGNNRGGTGLDTSGATNGQLLIGNGAGLSLGTLSNNGGIAITNGAGSIGLAVSYGSSANTAVQGNTTLTCASGTGDLSGGGNSITLGAGGTCSNITISESPAFDTSVTTPLITNAGALTLNTSTTAGADDIIFSTGSTELLRLLENGNLFFERGANDASIVVSTPSGSPATYTFSGATGTVLTTANYSANLDAGYVNVAENPAAGDISGSYTAGFTVGANAVALGADTTGDYVQALGSLTGLSVSGNSGEGSTPGLSVLYGSSANTAVQGNTQLTCASGSGNLTGGGTVITLGSGGTCASISTNPAVSFATSVTTPLITNAGALTIQTTGGSNDLTFTSGSGLIFLNATQINSTASLAFNMANSGATTFSINNSGSGVAGLSVEGGGSFGGLVTGTAGLTMSGAPVSLNVNSNNSTSINTGSSTGSITIGGGGNVLTIDSSAFDVTSGGLVSGVAGYSQGSGNFSIAGTGTFATGSGLVGLNGATTVSTSTNSATALTVNGTTGTAATALDVVQTGNAANLTLSNSARTSGALVSLTQNTSAFTGTGLLMNMASGSGSFASGNFADFQINGTSRFKVDNTGALQITSDSASGLNVRSTGGLDYFDVDVTGNLVRIGSATADATGVLFVLDTKNTAGDPTGVNGGSYYNSSDKKSRCYENGAWTDCISTAVVGETTLGSANATISINLDYAVESLQCRVEIKGRSGAAVPYLRFNNDSTGNAYSWNQYGITGTTVIDSQDNSDSEIQLSGTATATTPFSADLNITNFSDTRKGVDWTAIGIDPIGTNANRFSGVGVFNLTSGSISSVQLIASTGTFNAGSHLWCQGRNTR